MGEWFDPTDWIEWSLGEPHQDDAHAAVDKREPRYGQPGYGEYRPWPVPDTDPVLIDDLPAVDPVVTDPLPDVDPVPVVDPVLVDPLPAVDPVVPEPSLVNDTIPGFPGPITDEPPSNSTTTEPLPSDFCFSTGEGRKKRSPANDKRQTADTVDEEFPLRTTLRDYIREVIDSFDGEKCPGRALLEPPRPDGGDRKRSNHLAKRVPQTLAELIKLFVSTYNDCPEEGYRKRQLE